MSMSLSRDSVSCTNFVGDCRWTVRSGADLQARPRRGTFSRSTSAPTLSISSAIGRRSLRRSAVGRPPTASPSIRTANVWERPLRAGNGAGACPRHDANPITISDETRKETGAWRGMFVWPHGIHVRQRSEILVDDARLESNATKPRSFPENPRRERRRQFSPETASLLMRSRQARVMGNPPEASPTEPMSSPRPSRATFTWPEP